MSSFVDTSEICRSILESLPTGLCVVDVQKKIVFWSDGAERITGHLRHEVIGHSCISEPILHCDQAGCEFCNENCPAAHAIKMSHPAEAVGFLHHKAGHEVPVRVRAVPVRNEHGSIIGAAETFENLVQTAGPNLHDQNPRIPGFTDEVTGLASRAVLQSHLRQGITKFAGLQTPVSVLCVRLEGLQHFRASLGLEAASSLLRVIARSLESTLWTTDFVGRWSDDQFLIILNGCREKSMHIVRERLRHLLANNSIEWWGERHSLTVSIGEATAQVGDTLESMMERAQKSLDRASSWQAHASATDSELSGS